MTPLFKGSGTALVTPFNESGVNLAAFEKLLEFQLENGTDALIVCGTTGEPSTMTENEKQLLIEFAVKYVDGRVPVIVGAGGNNTAECVQKVKRIRDMGVDALLLVTPYYNKATQEGIIRHFDAIDEAANLPYIIYNVPVRTGLNLLPSTVQKMLDRPNLAGVKEASGDIAHVAEIARLCGERMPVYSGSDENTLAILALGGAGVISVVANVAPALVKRLCELFFMGEIKAALEVQLHLLPLVKALFAETSPSPVKTAMAMQGRRVGAVRLPLVAMEPGNEKALRSCMERMGLL